MGSNTRVDSIVELIKARPGVRNSEIAEELDIDASVVQPMLQRRIANSEIIVEKVQAGGRYINAYRYNPKWTPSDAAFQPERAAPRLEPGESNPLPVRQTTVPASQVKWPSNLIPPQLSVRAKPTPAPEPEPVIEDRPEASEASQEPAEAKAEVVLPAVTPQTAAKSEAEPQPLVAKSEAASPKADQAPVQAAAGAAERRAAPRPPKVRKGAPVVEPTAAKSQVRVPGTAKGFQFRFSDISERNRTYTMDRVAYSVTQPKPNGYFVVSLMIGWNVLKKLGWKGGYDRVQICEQDGLIAISRECGQFKLCKTTESGQTVVQLSARRFKSAPAAIKNVTALDFSILERGDNSSEKVLVFKAF